MRFNLTRRTLLKASAAGLGATMLPVKFMKGQAWAVANSTRLNKWVQPLRPLWNPAAGPEPIQGGIPIMSSTPDPVLPNTNFYQVTVGEFTDKLHPQLGLTKLWGYWDTTNPKPRHLGGVIIATRGTASRIRFTNSLPKSVPVGYPQLHIIPVDTTIPGPNQQQNRVATHLHGGLVPWISDGGPHDWFDPNGVAGLSFPNGPLSVLDNIPGKAMVLGQADYFYPNDQSTRLVWYHDHAWGITRVNAYAGIATGYLILDLAQETKLSGKIPSINSTVPLVWQDKIFVDPTTITLTDPTWQAIARPDVQSLGSLWYDHVYDPRVFKLATGRDPVTGTKYLAPPPNPSCIPEFFGDTMLCNGTVYPYLQVEPKPYRFLMLNACNARFLNINTFVADNSLDGITLNPRALFPVNPPGPNMIQIGTEGGYLPYETTHVSPKPFNPALLTGNLLLGNAERADVIIDFTAWAGKDIILYNDAPGPFPAGPPTTDYFLGNPKNPVQPFAGTGPDTRQILRIKVGLTVTASEPTPTAPILDPTFMDPAPIATLPLRPAAGAAIAPLTAPTGTPTWDLTLNEDFDNYGRLRQLLGTTAPALGKGGAAAFGLEYMQPATEIFQASSTWVWRIFNLTADTHPIHFHLVNVQVLSRQPFKIVNGIFTPTGAATGPQANELGWKETVQMHPGQVTSVLMKFDLPPVPFEVPFSTRTMVAAGAIAQANEFVWHCHILEHEEHDMMRPLVITGTNPVTQITVTPATAQLTGSTGGTANYGVNNSTGFNVASSDPAYTVAGGQIVLGPAGFAVTVPAGALVTTVTFTITDGTGRTAATATLQIL